MPGGRWGFCHQPSLLLSKFSPLRLCGIVYKILCSICLFGHQQENGKDKMRS